MKMANIDTETCTSRCRFRDCEFASRHDLQSKTEDEREDRMKWSGGNPCQPFSSARYRKDVAPIRCLLHISHVASMPPSEDRNRK